MYRLAYLIIFIAILLMAITSINVAANEPQIGDQVVLEKGLLVNPRDWGPQSWLLTEPDTCYLSPGQAIVREKDGRMLRLEQEGCSGWAPETRVQR